MFYIFSTYQQLWIKLLTTLKYEYSKRNFCQEVFLKRVKIFYVEISTFYFVKNNVVNPRLWTTYRIY